VSKRLVLSTLAVVIVVVILLGVPLGVAMRNAIDSSAAERVRRDAQGLLDTVEVRAELGEPIDEQSLRRYVADKRFARVVLPATGKSITIGTEPKEDNPIVARLTGPQGEVVTVMESRSEVAAQTRRAWLLILIEAFFAVGTAGALAALQARSLTRPLVELADAAEQLGSNDGRRRRHRRYGLPEVDRVADVLDRSSDRIARILGAERQFAAHASHQLRTPLTALSMRLEEIAESNDLDSVREEAAVALSQVERLTDVVHQLLTYQRSPSQDPAELVDVDKVVQQQIDEWRPAYEKEGRRLQLVGIPGLFARATPGSVSQVVATLVENALVHGDGTVTIRTRTVGGSVVVEVTDEGPGVPEELGQRVFEQAVSSRSSTGLGLALARDLAQADGARLELVQQRPAVFALFLAVPDEEESA
jgi:signal transduction histidine kinase